LLVEYGVPYGAFGRKVMECLPREGEGWVVPGKGEGVEWRDREDLRELIVCSIDPPGQLFTFSWCLVLIGVFF
jgi:exosome complex exonuclease DIS3/RRP44